MLQSFPELTDEANSVAQVKSLVHAHPNVLAFYARLQKQLFPDGTSTQWERPFAACVWKQK